MWRSVLPEQPNVMTVPQTAVITSLYGDYVYTIDEETADGKAIQVAKQVFVKTGRRRGGALEIVSGVQRGSAGGRLRAEQAAVRCDRQDRQLHRCDEARHVEARERAIGISHEFY